MKKHRSLLWTAALLATVMFSVAQANAEEPDGKDNDPSVLSPAYADYMRGEESSEEVMNAMERGLAVRQLRGLKPMQRNLRSGALSGKRINLSGGHGIMRDGAWRWQRGITNEVREDLHTYEWINDFIRPMLDRAGAETLFVRASGYAETSRYVDYNDASNYKEEGKWTKSSTGDYRYASCEASESATATWSFSVESDDYYSVYVRYYTGGNRSTKAKYTISHARGETEVTQDQSELRIISGTSSGSDITKYSKKDSSNYWHFLGSYPFKAGETGFVRLSNEDATDSKVVIADAVFIGDGPGTIVNNSNKTSGQFKWQESALAFFEWMGMPSWLRTNDVSSRCLYSLYEGVDAQFSMHTNAGNTKSRGTTTWVWYPTDANGNQQWVSEKNWSANYAEKNLPPGTYTYAKLIHTRFGEYIKKYYTSDWTIPEGLSACNFGEIRPARNAWYFNQDKSPLIIPAIIMEAAYHDNAADARIISDQEFRFYGARGILAGMIQYFNGENAMIPPLPPKNLSVTAKEGKLVLKWEAVNDEVITNSKPTKYHIYLSDDGLLFDTTPTYTVETTSAEIALKKGHTIYVRVTAANEAGESLDSITGVGRLPNLNQKQILYVDGVDRQIKTAYDANNPRTYARIYGAAISFSNAGYGIDFVDDEAVVEQLKNKNYDLVIWSTSETSIATDVLNAQQRAQIKQLRTAGTSIIISGAELGYALDNSNYCPDKNYLADVFDAVYTDDNASPDDNPDAEKFTSSGYIAQALTFSSCIQDGGKVGKPSADASCIEYPDVISPTNGATTIASYESGASAGILSADGKLIFMGFPLENIAEKTDRICYIAHLIDKVLGNEVTTTCKASVYVQDAEVCNNGLDDDEDGITDCNDTDCEGDEFCEEPIVDEICNNGIDDDKDGRTDCNDPDCNDNFLCQHVSIKEICDNQNDDDGDGAIDCDDPECTFDKACKVPAEICDNGIDDDKDGRTDCKDPDCISASNCQSSAETPDEICDNGVDDDKDGDIDCDDADCTGNSKCKTVRPPHETVSEEICDNNYDDDGDGKADCEDSECAHFDDCNPGGSNGNGENGGNGGYNGNNGNNGNSGNNGNGGNGGNSEEQSGPIIGTDDGCGCTVQRTPASPTHSASIAALSLLIFGLIARRRKQNEL